MGLPDLEFKDFLDEKKYDFQFVIYFYLHCCSVYLPDFVVQIVLGSSGLGYVFSLPVSLTPSKSGAYRIPRAPDISGVDGKNQD